MTLKNLNRLPCRRRDGPFSCTVHGGPGKTARPCQLNNEIRRGMHMALRKLRNSTRCIMLGSFLGCQICGTTLWLACCEAACKHSHQQLKHVENNKVQPGKFYFASAHANGHSVQLLRGDMSETHPTQSYNQNLLIVCGDLSAALRDHALHNFRGVCVPGSLDRDGMGYCPSSSETKHVSEIEGR